MKFSVMADNLTPALTIAQRSVSKRSTLPVLENVRIESGDGYVTLDTTDLTVWSHVRVPAKVDEPGATTVKAADLLAIAKLASREETRRLDISADAKRLSVTTGDATRGLPVIDVEEFPAFRQPKSTVVLTFQSGELRRGLAEAAFAMAGDEARPILTGVSLRYTGRAPEFCAADNYRLAVTEVPHLAVKGEVTDTVLRGEFVNELVKLLPDTEDTVTLTLDRAGNMSAVDLTVYGNKRSKGAPAFELEVTVVASLIDGTFPNYRAVIPAQKTLTGAVTTNRQKLLNAFAGAKTVAENAANIVRLAGDRNGIKVTADDGEGRTFESLVPGELHGDAFRWAGDVRYLLSLREVDDELVRFSTSGPLVPGIFDVPGRENWLYTVMPVRTTS